MTKNKNQEIVFTIADYQQANKELHLKVLNLTNENRKIKTEVVESTVRYISCLEKTTMESISIIQKLEEELRTAAVKRMDMINTMIETMKTYWNEDLHAELCRASARHIWECVNNFNVSSLSGVPVQLIKEIDFTCEVFCKCINETLEVIDNKKYPKIPLRESPEFNYLMRFIDMMKGTFRNYANFIEDMEITEFKLEPLKNSERLDKTKTASETVQVQEAA